MKVRRIPEFSRKANRHLTSSLLDEEKENGLNLSQVLEKALRAEYAMRWHEENRDAIEAYNARIERDGIWSSGWRTW